jgi:hypothetical protein
MVKEIKILVSVVYFGLLKNISILGADFLDIEYTSVLIFMLGVVFKFSSLFFYFTFHQLYGEGVK